MFFDSADNRTFVMSSIGDILFICQLLSLHIVINKSIIE